MQTFRRNAVRTQNCTVLDRNAQLAFKPEPWGVYKWVFAIGRCTAKWKGTWHKHRAVHVTAPFDLLVELRMSLATHTPADGDWRALGCPTRQPMSWAMTLAEVNFP